MQPLEWYRIAGPVVACALLVIVAVLRPIPRLRMTALGMIAAVSYGALQDQVSARLCPEYFTVLHPPIPGLTDPTLLGVAWGFLGAWWCGAGLGYGVGLATTLGHRPPLSIRDLIRPVVLLLAAVGATTALTAISVWQHVEMFGVTLRPEITAFVPLERHHALLVVACYHFSAYGSSVLGSIVLFWWIAGERKRRSQDGAIASGSPGPSVVLTDPG